MAEKRKLFEEVGDGQIARPPADIGVIDRGRGGARAAIRLWLFVLFALVFVMIAVGGLTRLTDSGLSITEWKPFTGAMPPLSEADWQGHRQLGRLIGMVWALGFLWFLVRRQIPVGWTGRLVLLGGLGGLQGAIGWWMVSSGVTVGKAILDVASYRLATHLGLAFIILGVITWYALLLGRTEKDLMQARRTKERKLFGMSTGLLHFAFLQILLGALVAGIDAGRFFIDWPLMQGQFFPPDAFNIVPVWRNFFENPGLVQFLHRMTGYLLFAFAIVVWLRGRKSAHDTTRAAFNLMLIAMVGQVGLGIFTVLNAAPVHIAIVHQALAVVLWVLILRARFLSGYPVPTSLRGNKP